LKCIRVIHSLCIVVIDSKDSSKVFGGGDDRLASETLDFPTATLGGKVVTSLQGDCELAFVISLGTNPADRLGGEAVWDITVPRLILLLR
jgi:hypothetical protein